MTSQRNPTSSSGGFSMIELLVALAIALLVTSAVFAMLDPANGAFQTQPEVADVLQRLRASTDVLHRELVAAGSGPAIARGGRASSEIPAAVFPMRVGRRSPDTPGTFDASRISLWYISPSAPQATLASPLLSASGTADISPGPGCPDADVSCGFRSGTTVIVSGRSGAWDLFSVTNVQGSTLTLQHNLRDSASTFEPESTVIAEATARTYFFRNDRTTGIAQLMRYDGAGGADVPVIDHIVSLEFQYAGDAQPPALVGGTAPGEPVRTTYGPSPPDAGIALTAYPAGENCAFARGADGAVVPRLSTLAPEPVLVPLPASILTDGPWCPDAASPNRYDADLLRVRQVAVTLRIEAAMTSLRGPAGQLFARGGTARGTRFVADRSVRLVVAPRALNAGR